MELMPLPEGGQSKIETYGLSEYVAECYLQNINCNRIATLCNKKLEERKSKDAEFQFQPINAQNVKVFVKSKEKEKEFSLDRSTAPLLNQVGLDIVSELSACQNMLKGELDKLRDPDTSVSASNQEFFIELIDRMQKTWEIAANVTGKVQPSINIAILKTNVDKIVNKIAEHKDIPREIKDLVLSLILEDFFKDITNG